MNSVDPGSPKWIRAEARLQKLRYERSVENARQQHHSSRQLGSRTLRWTIAAAVAAIIGALAALFALLQSSQKASGARRMSPSTRTTPAVRSSP